MTLILHMLRGIFCLPVEQEWDHFTLTEVFNKIMILSYGSYFLDVQYFYSAVSSLDDCPFKLTLHYNFISGLLIKNEHKQTMLI